MGPSAIRIAGLTKRLLTLGCSLVDKGDIPSSIPETKRAGDHRKKYIREIARTCNKVYQIGLNTLTEGAFPLVLGGDHSVAAGSVAATAAYARRRRRGLGVIWVDAHAAPA